MAKLHVRPVPHRAAGTHSEDGGGVSPCGAVVVQLWVRIAEEEQQRQSDDGRQGAGQLEVVERFPERVGEQNQDGGNENATNHILKAQQQGQRLVSVSDDASFG